jgi:hypothetical protein
MKAIINGTRYDTEKADLLASASSELSRSDFGWWEEDLYRTQRSKAYFLAGIGNARSHYSTSQGGGTWGPGSKITPMTEAEAFAWAERNLNVEKVEELFPALISDA